MVRQSSFLSIALALIATSAMAQSHIIPYQGKLAQDGTAADGQYDIRVRLHDPGDDSVVWTEDFSQVEVSAGAFSIGLGTTVPLDDDWWLIDGLYVTIAVRRSNEPSEPNFIDLTNRQRILPVPRTVRGEMALDFEVVDELFVGSRVGIGAADGTVPLRVDGPDNNGVVAPLKVTAGGQTLLVGGNEIDSNGPLYLQNNSSERTEVGGDLAVNGAVSGPNLWVQVYEADLSAAASALVSGLDGNRDKVYKVIFQGTVATAGTDTWIRIRPNDRTGTFNGWCSFSGSAGGYDYHAAGLYAGRTGWTTNASVTLEYTFGARGGRRAGFGHAMFVMTNNNMLGHNCFGYWDHGDSNITSLRFEASTGTLTGKLMVFAAR